MSFSECTKCDSAAGYNATEQQSVAVAAQLSSRDLLHYRQMRNPAAMQTKGLKSTCAQPCQDRAATANRPMGIQRAEWRQDGLGNVSRTIDNPDGSMGQTRTARSNFADVGFFGKGDVGFFGGKK